MSKLFTVEKGDLIPLQHAQLPREDMLETWIAKDPGILGLNAAVIGRQVVTDFGGKIDILLIDAEGALTIIELKRHKTPREVIAQALDYASWVASLSAKDVYDIALKYMQKTLDPYSPKHSARMCRKMSIMATISPSSLAN